MVSSHDELKVCFASAEEFDPEAADKAGCSLCKHKVVILSRLQRLRFQHCREALVQHHLILLLVKCISYLYK